MAEGAPEPGGAGGTVWVGLEDGARGSQGLRMEREPGSLDSSPRAMEGIEGYFQWGSRVIRLHSSNIPTAIFCSVLVHEEAGRPEGRSWSCPRKRRVASLGLGGEVRGERVGLMRNLGSRITVVTIGHGRVKGAPESLVWPRGRWRPLG